MLGVPSIAVSLASKHEDADYDAAACFAAELTPTVLEKGNWSRRTFLNVNVPDAKVRGVRITSQGRREYFAKVEERVDPRGRRAVALAEGDGDGGVRWAPSPEGGPS